MKVKDPVCGMEVDSEEAEKKGLFIKKDGKTNYFCSEKCKSKFLGKKEPWYRSKGFGKAFPWFLGLVLVGFSIASIVYDFMILYMGIFFILFSLMKMLDWKGFVNAYSTYDLIAARTRVYGWAYPGIEFVLGILYLFNIYITGAAWVTLVIMGIGGIGVGIKISKKEKFQCACLGTKINVPLTKITLLEDIIMFIMAVMLLWF